METRPLMAFFDIEEKTKYNQQMIRLTIRKSNLHNNNLVVLRVIYYKLESSLINLIVLYIKLTVFISN